ncbi:MAG TPA: FtsQ-type POTRA domain-containing protein [Gemmatimonadaceae bacterium]|nr:FtsQ-type POTRA domain-containing protein [Gemmatimonadaceae bacterium]
MSDPIIPVSRARKRGIRWRLVATILFLLVVGSAAFFARRGASKMDFFHVRAVEVEGVRYLEPSTVLERMAIDTMRSVWDDYAPLVARVKSLPQVTDVVITRKLPGTLVVTIHENLPVALSPSPRGLEAVDSVGVVLPIDPASTDLDLPVALQRDVSMLRLLGSLRSHEPILFRRISEIGRDGRDGVLMHLERRASTASIPDSVRTDSNSVVAVVAPRVLRVRALLGVSVSRLADIFPVESDLLRRRANVAELDLRYRDQVIARLQ